MRHGLCVLWVLGSLSPLALGGVPDPDFGMDWATVGDPGNRGTNASEGNIFGGAVGAGSVGYTYQMAVTEVTVGQYAEFAQAYAPLYRQRTGFYSGSFDFTGADFQLVGGGTPSVQLYGDVSPNQPIEVSWEYAARYVNWLHNGKGTDAASFDQGVYDTSTFTQNPDGSWNHTTVHDPNASVWMASLDEWTKAAYWDPNKDGVGGYWRFPNGSDVEPVPYEERNNGLPDGDLIGNGNEPLDVGQFPDVQSPWGVLDMSGGASEWSESPTVVLGVTNNHRRWVLGTDFGSDGEADPFFFSYDALGYWGADSVFGPINGIRLVRPIPTPGSMSLLFVSLIYYRRTKR